jgi:hypothetical protein
MRKKIFGPSKVTVISDQHLGIRAVLGRPDFRWQESADEIVHHYCTQHIAQNMYKDCHIKKNKDSFQISCKT